MTVAELLADEKNWCQGSCAKDDLGHCVGPRSPTANRWCLAGAVAHVYSTEEYPNIINRIILNTSAIFVSLWNDHPNRTHKEVLDLVTKLGI